MTIIVQLKLRYDKRLHRRLKAAARREGRSLNAEIMVRLQQSFSNEDIKDVISKAAWAGAEAVGRRWIEGYRLVPRRGIDGESPNSPTITEPVSPFTRERS